MKRIHVDLRLVMAAVLALAAGAVVQALTRPAPHVEVLVAAAPLPPGVRLGDLAISTRQMSPAPGLIPADRRAELADHALRVALAEGEPIVASLLTSPPGDRPDVVAITLDPAHAVQGDLVAGDRIDVYVSLEGTTVLLAPDVLVITATTGTGGLAGGDTALLLAVDRRLARDLVEAVHTAEIDLVRRPR